jgi:hypothetical protein
MRRSHHSTIRRMVGASVVVLATVVPAGVAAAADYPLPPGPDVSPNSGSTVKANTASNPSTLPFTGGDVAGLALIGVGAALAGTVLVRRSRRPVGV